MLRVFAVVAACAALASPASAAAAEDAALIEKGKAVFASAKPPCKTCHNDKKNSLADYGSRGTAEEIEAWLRTPKEMLEKTGKKGPKPAFSPEKLSEEDLEALTAYLLSLKE